MAEPEQPAKKKRERASGPSLTPTLRAFLKKLKQEGKLGHDPIEWLLARELKEWERVNGKVFDPVPGGTEDEDPD